MYTGILLARLRKHHPLVTTYGELGESLFGKKVGYACYAILYIYIFFVLGEYMVVMSRSIQGVFYNTDMCRPVAGILSCLILFISNQARTLRNIAFLSIVSFVTIFIVLTICLHDIENDGVVCSVRARSARIPFYHSLENRSNTSISFVRTYEITHNNSPFVKTLELHKKTQLALEHRYRIRSMMLYAVFRFGTFTERSVHLYSRGVDRKFI